MRAGCLCWRHVDKHWPAMLLTFPLAFPPQMVPDLDPHAKRQHWHRTPGAATGSEKCRPLGKGFRRSLFEGCALGFCVCQALPRP